jgi:integrase/recombinase XerD
LERYRLWLEDGGVALSVIEQHRIPMAGHVLGLHLKPHSQLNLDSDLDKAMDYVWAKNLSEYWTSNCRHSLNWFRRFLCEERGIELAEYAPPYTNVERYKNGLPDWLVEALEQFLRLRQANWRKSHKDASMMQAWAKYTHLCRWLFDNVDISELPDIQQRHVYAYMDAMLARGYATSSVNGFLYCFHEVLRFMQSRGTEVPQVLLAVRGLKVPERLPRFLTDEQVLKVRADLEKRVKEARTPAKIRDSLLDRAAFYLLWHGGLRLGELELLSITDLNLSKRKLVVRQGKGLKDRSVYLTEVAVCALEEYLAVRGPGKSDHAFLYRFKPLCKDLIRDRTKAAGKRTGVKVTPHMLRHTFGTQLVNAGCRITTIQALLGHQRLNSTMTYARVHDQTVARDYYSAMLTIEGRLQQPHHSKPEQMPDAIRPLEQPPKHLNGHILELVNALATTDLDSRQIQLVNQLRTLIPD